MNWDTFENNLREALEIPDDQTMDKNDVLKDSDYWSSMHALLVMAMAESEFNISINGEELRSAETLNDLYLLLSSKQE